MSLDLPDIKMAGCSAMNVVPVIAEVKGDDYVCV